MSKLVCYEPCAQCPSEGFMRCLNSFSCTAEVIRNCWLVETRESPVAICEKLKPFTCPGDRLFIVACCREAAWAGRLRSPTDKIRSILNSCPC